MECTNNIKTPIVKAGSTAGVLINNYLGTTLMEIGVTGNDAVEVN